MFESDQHEFDEEYEELSHSAPPPPMPARPAAPSLQSPDSSQESATASARTSASAAPPVALAEPTEEEKDENEPEESSEYDEQELQEYSDAAEQQEPPVPAKKKPNLVILGGFAALIIFAIFVVYTATKPKDNAAPPGDMGPGIVAVSGLRGHLNTRWEGSAKTGRLAYQMHIEPMEDRWQAGFSRVVLKAPVPIYVNVRLLDATGYALCGKQIEFRFDPQNGEVPAVTAPLVGSNGKKLTLAEREAAVQAARQSEIAQMQAAEAQRERGRDIFQDQLGNDGLAMAVNVQGSLPCSPDQFRQANYWDFNTNFPTLDEQADLLDPKAAARRAKEAELATHPRGPRKLPLPGFVMQGDDRITGYDSARGMLWAQQGETFQIDRRLGQATATAWANNNSLIHYRCDQHASCALTAAGGTAVLHARLSN